MSVVFPDEEKREGAEQDEQLFYMELSRGENLFGTASCPKCRHRRGRDRMT